jgi:hypothetical protein
MNWIEERTALKKACPLKAGHFCMAHQCMAWVEGPFSNGTCAMFPVSFDDLSLLHELKSRLKNKEEH